MAARRVGGHDACVLALSSPPVSSPESLLALRAKYVEMRRMRLADTAPSAPDPREDMAALAARFPGALREIDELTLEEIDARIGEIEEVIAGAAAEPAWVACLVDYHGWMRVALRIKRRAAEGLDGDALLEELAATYAPGHDEPPRAAIGPEVIAQILAPPLGRLNPWVFERIAQAHGLTSSEVEAILFRRR